MAIIPDNSAFLTVKDNGQVIPALEEISCISKHELSERILSECQSSEVEQKYHLPQAWATFLDNSAYHWNWYGHFTFRDYPHPETAGKAWDKWVHILNRECFGHYYWKDKRKGVTWARASEDQKRGAIHFHALLGNIPDKVSRLKFKEVWFEMAGICRIYAYEKDKGAEFYMSKSTYAWKRGEIDLSATLRHHSGELVLPSQLR